MINRKQRIPMRDLATMAAEDRETVEKNAMNGQIFNIFKVLAHHPKLVKRWTPFAGRLCHTPASNSSHPRTSFPPTAPGHRTSSPSDD